MEGLGNVRGSMPFKASATVRVVINALSAAGSRMVPSTECMLNRLAKYPSTCASSTQTVVAPIKAHHLRDPRGPRRRASRSRGKSRRGRWTIRGWDTRGCARRSAGWEWYRCFRGWWVVREGWCRCRSASLALGPIGRQGLDAHIVPNMWLRNFSAEEGVV